MIYLYRLEEAGFYLSTFKSFEHKPPDLIKERVDKEFSAMYRTSLTSISKVNKTDVETLKTNFGVRNLFVKRFYLADWRLSWSFQSPWLT
jgi:DNA excision repair protein ERCC-1